MLNFDFKVFLLFTAITFFSLLRITCDLIDGLLRIYNKEGDTECQNVIHLPGSEFAVDSKEPLQFSIDVKHPQLVFIKELALFIFLNFFEFTRTE